MSEDYTWDETVTAHGYAVQNAALKRVNASLAARVRELEQLVNLAPDYALYYVGCILDRIPPKSFGVWSATALQQDADDTDAPLTLAPLDEDGDE